MIQIAFCDDDQTVLDQLSALLEKYRTQRCIQIQCTAFRSPLDLLAEIEKGVRYDILFLDVIMPAENGITVAKEYSPVRHCSRDHLSHLFHRVCGGILYGGRLLLSAQAHLGGKLFPTDRLGHCRVLPGRPAQSGAAVQDRHFPHRAGIGCCTARCWAAPCCSTFQTAAFWRAPAAWTSWPGSWPPMRFFLRPHRSFLVNMEYVQNISSRAVTLTNLVQIPIPHGKSSDIRRQYLEYAFRRKQVML